MVRRSKRPKFPLWRTRVKKLINRGCKLPCPHSVTGVLIDFSVGENKARTYTVEWDDHSDNESSNTDLRNEISPFSSQSVTANTSDCIEKTEVWTESRVSFGIMLYRYLGVKVAKKNDPDVQVQKQKILNGLVVDVCDVNSGKKSEGNDLDANPHIEGDEHDGEFLYKIRYEDGDSETMDFKELKKCIDLYHKTQKKKKRNQGKTSPKDCVENKKAKTSDSHAAICRRQKIFIGQVEDVYRINEDNESEANICAQTPVSVSANDAGEYFYHIRYEDGDTEDVDLEELLRCIDFYNETRLGQSQMKAQANQKGHLGVKVAKKFDVVNDHLPRKSSRKEGTDFIMENGIKYFQKEMHTSDDYGEDVIKILNMDLTKNIKLIQILWDNQVATWDRYELVLEDWPELLMTYVDNYNTPTSETTSFEALYDKTVPIHTLILGTHPADVSLKKDCYYANTSNAFWWIAGDCLGFRRDKGLKRNGDYMSICSDLRYDESHVIPYEEQVALLCRSGFALWDLIATCRRNGSLDGSIRNDKPNNVRQFVKQHPSIKTIVLANGKGSCNIFKNYFKWWWESGELFLHTEEQTGPEAIKVVCALSVSPSAASLTYKEKRDFWDEFVYSPGLTFHKNYASKGYLTPAATTKLDNERVVTASPQNETRLPYATLVTGAKVGPEEFVTPTVAALPRSTVVARMTTQKSEPSGSSVCKKNLLTTMDSSEKYNVTDR